ncbi:MAG: hypothetical protein ACOX3T_02415 [Bdellovibrionota bacterium]
MYNIGKILPHRETMVFISGVESVDLAQGLLTARVDTKETDILYDKELGGIPAYVSLEYMAQSVGCFTGINDISENSDATPQAGFLIGSRKLEIFTPIIEANKSYYIDIKSLFCDDNIVSFECRVYDEKLTIAKATLNAYRPKDINDFKNK